MTVVPFTSPQFFMPELLNVIFTCSIWEYTATISGIFLNSFRKFWIFIWKSRSHTEDTFISEECMISLRHLITYRKTKKERKTFKIQQWGTLRFWSSREKSQKGLAHSKIHKCVVCRCCQGLFNPLPFED